MRYPAVPVKGRKRITKEVREAEVK